MVSLSGAAEEAEYSECKEAGSGSCRSQYCKIQEKLHIAVHMRNDKLLIYYLTKIASHSEFAVLQVTVSGYTRLSLDTLFGLRLRLDCS